MSVESVTSGSAGYDMLENDNLFKPVGKSELDQHDFMNLFITQLQHQDPMEPMDTSEMASQLAEFSNMEATLRMSDNMEKLLEYQVSQNNLQLLTLLDTDVQVLGNTLGVSEGEPGAGEFVLSADTDTCVVEIYDAGGHLVRVMDMGPSSSGDYPLDWDGKDMRDEPVEDGAYTYWVKGYSALGEQVAVDYSVTGNVTGIKFDNGAAMLTVDKHVNVDVGSVVSVL